MAIKEGVAMTEKPVVLIVEDDISKQDMFKTMLAAKVELLHAYNISQAQELFRSREGNFVAIGMDLILGLDKQAGILLTREFRNKGFKGPMVGISSVLMYRNYLVQAGCSHECAKNDLPALLCQILNL